MHLPHLEIMELWSPGVGERLFFRYKVEKIKVKLTVGATWQFTCMRSPEGFKAWRRVSHRHADDNFEYVTKSISAGNLPKPLSIFEYLKLKYLL